MTLCVVTLFLRVGYLRALWLPCKKGNRFIQQLSYSSHRHRAKILLRTEDFVKVSEAVLKRIVCDC
uniref:Secreted protein n=1 Tax=Ciona intestinalis TaxID=7719 RepID=H2Y102_CIOIN